MTLKNNRAPLLCCFKLCASFHSHQWNLAGVTVRKRPIWVKIDGFFFLSSPVTLKFDRWPWQTIGHIVYATSSFVHHFKAIGKLELTYSPETPNLGQNRLFFLAMWPWNLTDDLDRAPLLNNIKLCAQFHHHMWIQPGVTVRKRLSCVLNTSDLDLWPLTLIFCMDVTFVSGNNSWKFHDDTMMGT